MVQAQKLMEGTKGGDCLALEEEEREKDIESESV